jgi:hypothetical protein
MIPVFRLKECMSLHRPESIENPLVPDAIELELFNHFMTPERHVVISFCSFNHCRRKQSLNELRQLAEMALRRFFLLPPR